MKISKEKAAENRAGLLREAARLFRERGVADVGVDAVAAAAGLTHGSLYSHFGSKEALVAASLEAGWANAVARAPGVATLDQALAIYLSPQHRDSRGNGCFMAALGSDMPRQSKKIRRSFTDIVAANIARIASLLPGSGRKTQDDAMFTVAAMVGTLVLARAVTDPALSDRLLEVARRRLAAE